MQCLKHCSEVQILREVELTSDDDTQHALYEDDEDDDGALLGNGPRAVADGRHRLHAEEQGRCEVDHPHHTLLGGKTITSWSGVTMVYIHV